MAVYSQYNPATGQFEYFQGAPSAPSPYVEGQPIDWRYYGQADPQAYPDYWADPNGSLLAQAMAAGLGWTAPRAPAMPSADVPGMQMVPPEVRYIEPQAPHYATPLERSWLGAAANAVAGPNGYPARAARAISNAGRRHADYQEAYANTAPGWVEGIY